MSTRRTWTVIRLGVGDVWEKLLDNDTFIFTMVLLGWGMVCGAFLVTMWLLAWLSNMGSPTAYPTPPLLVRMLGLGLVIGGLGCVIWRLLKVVAVLGHRWQRHRANGGWAGRWARWEQEVLQRHPHDARRMEMQALGEEVDSAVATISSPLRPRPRL